MAKPPGAKPPPAAAVERTEGPADDPVLGLHHGIGDGGAPFHGADGQRDGGGTVSSRSEGRSKPCRNSGRSSRLLTSAESRLAAMRVSTRRLAATSAPAHRRSRTGNPGRITCRRRHSSTNRRVSLSFEAPLPPPAPARPTGPGRNASRTSGSRRCAGARPGVTAVFPPVSYSRPGLRRPCPAVRQ